LADEVPQVAFIGRSNAGKSSVINTLANRRELARSSSKPGKTTEINFFLLNKSFYLADLPGYGYAKASHKEREKLQKLINWYLFDSGVEQKLVVLVMDANVGLTANDLEMFHALADHDKNIVIVANKTDKLNQSAYKKQLDAIRAQAGEYPVIPYSAEKKTGVSELAAEIEAALAAEDSEVSI
jgi:GTP-binding protein